MEEDEPLPRSGCSRIAAGVERTVADGSADVEIALQYSFPSEPGDGPIPATMSTHLRGVVDFRSDRASLAGGGTSLMLDGTVSYQATPDGQWAHQAGRTGQWNWAHPRWALEVIRAGCQSTEQVNPSDVAVELDRDQAAGVTHPGLSPDWQTLYASTVFDDAGRLRRIEITTAGSASPGAWMRHTVEFTRFDPAAAQIDVPLNSVDLADYLGLDSPAGETGAG